MTDSETDLLEERGYDWYLSEFEKHLKRCPFCGGQAFYRSGIHIGYDESTGHVQCRDCGVEKWATLYSWRLRDPVEAAKEASWNERVALDD